MADPVRERVREQSPENLTAQRAETLRTMPLVGISPQYADRRFRDYAHGEKAKQLFLEQWPDTTELGRGITLRGEEPELGDLQMMMARAAHLAGMVVRVMSLVELAEAVRRGSDVGENEVGLEELSEAGALFVPYFLTQGKCPIHPYSVGAVVSMVERRFLDRRAFFPWILETSSEAWWPDHFLADIENHNKQLRIDE